MDAEKFISRTSGSGLAHYFTRDFQNYALTGRVLHGRSDAGRDFIFAVHGARSDHRSLDPLLFWLQAADIGSLSFDLSGHTGKSPVPLEETSLVANLVEASAFFALSPSRRVVLGQSMGGALALKIAEANELEVKKLVLVCPAIYPEAAYGPLFGPSFTDALSIPHGFLDSSSIAFLQRFKGDVMLIVGEHDGLRATDFAKPAGRSAGFVKIGNDVFNSAIPHEVFHAIESAVMPSRLYKLILPGCDHQISAWLREDPRRVVSLGRLLLDFLN